MILVTGAAGFIGSNLVAALNEDGRDDLVLCDWLGDDGRWHNLAKRSFSHLILPEQLPAYLSSKEAATIDLVLHMGAISDTTVADGDLVLQRNYQCTKTLWVWCAERRANFVYASSAATYGDGAKGFADTLDHAGLKALRPLNLYAWSKHVFDLYATGAPPVAPPRWYGLKFFNVFGPNEYHKEAMRSVICKLASEILAGRPVQLFKSHKEGYSDGGQMRDFVWIEDVCSAVVHLARGEAASGLYNIGSGRARSFADMIQAGYRAAGHDPMIEYVPMPEGLRASYQYFTEADTRKLRASGFNAVETGLENAVERYLHHYLAASDKYR